MTDPTSEMILDVQALGKKAYQEGRSGRDNPYRWSTDEALCTAWNRGYAMARTERAIGSDFPVGTFVPSVPGGLAGLRKVGDDRWEMISPDGSPAGKFVTEDFAKMLSETQKG